MQYNAFKKNLFIVLGFKVEVVLDSRASSRKPVYKQTTLITPNSNSKQSANCSLFM